MKLNKVFIEDEVALDLTQDTVTEEDVAEGKTFHKADGSEAVGTAVISEPTPTQEKTVTIDANKTVEITPDDGYALSKVTANVSVPVVDGGDYSKFISGNLYTVTIPADVAVIGEGVFNYTGVYEVVMHNNITTICNRAFYQTANLKKITIPASVNYIGQSVFAYSNIEEATIQCTPRSYDYYMFDSCSKLKKVTFEQDTFADGWMFRDCQNLEEVISPLGVKLAKEMFYRCYALNNITIRSGVTSIPERCFSNCAALTSITIPDSVTTIGVAAFNYCSALDIGAIGIPESVTTIGNSAFSYSGATVLTIPNTITSFGQNIFEYCNSLTKLVYNSDVNIPYGLCASCSNLEEVEINGAITEIADRAFIIASKLLEITIPATVTKIGDYAFYYCDNAKVTILADTPPTIGSRTFYASSSSAPLAIYVPADSVDAYKSATNWSSIASRIHSIEEMPQ